MEKKTTLCYIKNNGCYLMLYRNRKPDDPNEGKWLGIGGKFEPGETPDDCNKREVFEETGLRLKSAHFHGVIHFRADEYEDEDMYLYSSDDFEPADLGARAIFEETGNYEPPECDEGELKWIAEEDLMSLPMWEGDRIFLERLLEGREHISMTLNYVGDHCTVVEENVQEDKSMKELLERTCELFISNREILHDTFKWEGDEMNRLGSSLLTARQEKADSERLRECERVLKENSGFFSIFRGQLKIAVLCNMVNKEDPEKYLRNTERAYKLMKYGRGSDDSIHALAALSIAESARSEEELLELVERTSDIFAKLKADNRIKASGSSFMTAVMLAIANITDIDSFIEKTSKCKELLSDIIPKRALNTLCMLMAASQLDVEVGCNRVRTLHHILIHQGIKVGVGYEDAVLAGLTLLNNSDEEIAAAVTYTDSFLKEQKGFGLFGCGKETRHMYAAMLVIDALMPDNDLNKIAAAEVIEAAINSQYAAISAMMVTTNINLMIQNQAVMNNITASNING